jgi:glycosyltransferase involved in cell wall biosynthesis
VRVQVVDPSAYTPPYDRALCSALARAGAEVELVTSRFAYGPVAAADGYRVTELFYRHGPARPGSRLRFVAKLVQHPFDMSRLARGRGTTMASPDVRHFQWLTVQPYDVRAIRRMDGPVVLTAHDVLPREPRRGQVTAQRRLYEAVDAVVVHSEHGRRRLVQAIGLTPEKVSVIHHGSFDYLTRQPDERPLDPELASWLGDAPLVLFFGLLRPYKGVDVLLRAWAGVQDPGPRLLVAGLPKMPLEPLRELADARVRFLPRFITDPEIPALFRRADVVVLPYRQIDQSGVLYTALAFGKAIVATEVGGFPEVAAEGAARLVPPEDDAALGTALAELLADASGRDRLAAAAVRAAAGPYSWDASGDAHLALYRSLAGGGAR